MTTDTASIEARTRGVVKSGCDHAVATDAVVSVTSVICDWEASGVVAA